VTQRGRSREAGDEPTFGRTLHDAVVDERDGPLPALLLGLTGLAGVVDATSIRALDHVVVAAMTGMTGMTGMPTERGHRDPTRLRRALALLAFAVGVIVGGLFIRLVAIGAALAFGLLVIVVVGPSSHLVSRTSAPWSTPR
jgi:uncharacterized membrane protein YoaK (UPF0700 family)